MKNYDVVIIGAGQAGSPLAKKLAEAGMKTTLIEKRWVGGTCVNDGCTPTKAMIASARVAQQARKAGDLGIEIGKITIDFKKIINRKDSIVKSFRSSSEKGIESTKGLRLIYGEARFTGTKELTITASDGGEEKLTAGLIFINTGAETLIPPIKGLNDIDYLTSTTILDLQEVPEHLLIIGGNYIGLEFGQMFSRFGSKVTIVEKSSKIIGREDDDISDEISKILRDEGLTIITGTEADRIEKDVKHGVKVSLKGSHNSTSLKVSHVLIAVGRSPQTRSLGLDIAGIKTDEKGYILVNNKLETNVKGIYALGDVKGGPAFTHISYNDYTIVYRNLIEKTNYSIKNRPIPYCMFTDPQLGRIGISENEAKEKGLNYKVAILPMSQVARGIETGETLGMMKAVVDADTRKILGAAILASEGGEIMSVLEMAIEGNITYDQVRNCVFAHPTYAESLNNLFMRIKD